MIFNMVGGGGSGNIFAFIVATYPEGSTCTCSNGTKTLRAKDTSGSVVFNIPEAGTWTVSCTDGVHEAITKAVTIVDKGSSVSVTLSFGVLYDNGINYGGLIQGRYGATYEFGNVSFMDEYIYVNSQPTNSKSKSNAVISPTLVNVSNYSVLKTTFEILDKVNDAIFTGVGIVSAQPTFEASNILARTILNEASASVGEHTLSLSLNGTEQGYPVFYLNSGYIGNQANLVHAKIKKIWFE